MLVKNGIVKMPWEEENFFESKKFGFIAAVHKYETTKGTDLWVMFHDSKAFIINDNENDAPADHDMLLRLCKEMVDDDGEHMDEYYGEDIIDLSYGSVDTDMAEFYGISEEDCDDIDNRIADLENYYSVEVVGD